uniref:Uncharacterized protein n=1 Tax=Chromera velia CCMP2878 TaxID=1169474 RepID=A0A0G4HBQ7_9ALVE|eukprot:Cvel_26004.t1-p1 / transcript=Cvel_26004.t1 / gene=Cvel_26004 / organism=Chromera_velia_CCMP2878 / gene_product=hypothetical protein / transcript_product=hypothetical protein / location=Cvel_scaffold3026:5941-7317(-) / protein_length=459 / sequence_SO=supercontig / SO=protein_coding / is_pseudo=false
MEPKLRAVWDLLTADEAPNPEELDKLLGSGEKCDINTLNDDSNATYEGQTPLSYVLEWGVKGFPEIAHVLMKHGASPTACGHTCLASSLRHSPPPTSDFYVEDEDLASLVSKLIEAGDKHPPPSPPSKCTNSTNPCLEAVRHNHQKSLEVLLHAGFPMDPKALIEVVRPFGHRSLDLLRRLLSLDSVPYSWDGVLQTLVADPDPVFVRDWGHDPENVAAMLKTLLAHPFCPGVNDVHAETGLTPLMALCAPTKYGYIEEDFEINFHNIPALEILLAHPGVKVNYHHDYENALSRAQSKGNEGTRKWAVDRLLAAGAKPPPKAPPSGEIPADLFNGQFGGCKYEFSETWKDGDCYDTRTVYLREDGRCTLSTVRGKDDGWGGAWEETFNGEGSWKEAGASVEIEVVGVKEADAGKSEEPVKLILQKSKKDKGRLIEGGKKVYKPQYPDRKDVPYPPQLDE